MACRLRLLAVIGCCALLACFAAACGEERVEVSDPLAGRWILSAEGRPFITLTVERQHDQYAGSLTTPEHWSTSDGITFTKVGPGTLTRTIATASKTPTGLRLVVESPKNPNDKDEFDFVLVDPTHASLSIVGAPFKPWPLAKSTGTAVTASNAWDPERTYTIDLPAVPPNAEMTSIFDEDQAARQNWQKLTEAQRDNLVVQDALRRKRTRVLLDAGKLQAGEDFRRAAFVFQHGDTPEDFLFAHTLAVVALSMGDSDARWIAAATLDRYLTAIGKAQIYGTQFNRAASQEPYDRTLISDGLRMALNVPPVAQQRDPFTAASDRSVVEPSH